jgi:hypothetical protein
VLVQSGTLKLGSSDHSVFAFNINGSTAIYLGSGTSTLTGTGIIFLGNGTIYKETSTLKINDSSSAAKTFNAGSVSRDYNNIWFTGSGTGAFIIAGNGDYTFNDFKVDTPPHTIQFNSSKTFTVTTFTVAGTPGNYITLQSSTLGTNYTLTKAGGGTITCDYLAVTDCTATPSSTWIGDIHTIDGGGGNTGWTFNANPSDPVARTQTTLYDACSADAVSTNFVADTKTLFAFNTSNYAGTLTNNNVNYLIERKNVASGLCGVKATINKTKISTYDVGECDIALGDYDATRTAWYVINGGPFLYLVGSGSIKIYQSYAGVFQLLCDTGYTLSDSTDYVIELYVKDGVLVLKVDSSIKAMFPYSGYSPNAKTVYSFSTYGNASSYATTLLVKNIYDISAGPYSGPFPTHRRVD